MKERSPSPTEKKGASGAETSHSSGVSTSRIPGFAKLSSRERLQSLSERGLLSQEDMQVLHNTGGLPLNHAETFIENCVGGFTLPLGIATNFHIDGEDILIPMAVEESSVVAAASHGAKLARSGGGFFSEPTKTIATCQVQFTVSADVDVPAHFASLQDEIWELATQCHPKLVARGGGVTGVELRSLQAPGWWVIHIHMNTLEAMGANIVNTVAEAVGRLLPQRFPCNMGLKILTNLVVHRVTRVRCAVEFAALEMGGWTGAEAAERMEWAWRFADLDPFRAATHNKGIMNGIDPVVIATGNDWRAVEAGCHAWASLRGTYGPLTEWKVNEGRLEGVIAVPVAVGTVGGVTRLHPAVQSNLKLLGNPTADRLSAIIASVGLAQNLSALRALACEGIQKGHMALHEKNLEMMRRYDHIPQLSLVTGASVAHPESSPEAQPQ